VLPLLFLFAPCDPADLSSSDYHTRERATSALVSTWPHSRALIRACCLSPNPEVRARAFDADNRGANAVFPGASATVRLVLDDPRVRTRAPWIVTVQLDIVRADVLRFALESPDQHRLTALWLIVAPLDDYSLDGLPWATKGVHKRYSRDKAVCSALCEIVETFCVDADGMPPQLGCRPDLWNSLDPWMSQHMLGLDNVRFWARGLSDPNSYWKPDYVPVAQCQWWERRDHRIKSTSATEPPK
jgi:hypothetical protein